MKNIGSTLILFLINFAIITPNVVFASGVKDQQGTITTSSLLARMLISTEPSEKPEWVDAVPQSAAELFFIGTSQYFDTVANARDNARESARLQVLEYYGQVIERQAISISTITGSTRDTLSAYVNREDEIRTYAQDVVSEVGTVAYYTEKYLNDKNKEEYIVYTLHKINRQKAEQEISSFAKNISERYTASFSQWKTLRAALENCALVARSLEQNPLHRIMAYYDTSTGRAGLYEYVRMKINELSNSVSIEAIPARTIQETESLSTKINIRSSILPVTGLLDCRATIFGIGGSDGIPYPFQTASDDPYNLQIRNLQPGSYNVVVEILLSDLTGRIAKNSSSNFSFSVTQLNVLLDTPEKLEAGLKKAVDSLAANIPARTETVIGHFTMTGTEIPSELSVFLTEKTAHYAKNNQERKYRVMEGETEKAAVLSGFFTKRNDRVEVTFKLSTPNSERDGSHIFSISADLLERQMKIAIEPEKVPNVKLPDSKTGSINIEARLNSSTHTYKHMDELKLTVTADKDCYFKIIHIDVNSQMRMIFPERNDNNFLRAHESRDVFESTNSRYILCDPYGTETLVVVASPTQFPNIEREYNQPWKPATEAAISAAIAGAGQARYPITILKPHEEYEYAKPENMTELYRSIRDDAAKQNGYFEGNSAGGFYIINNVRGSYRVPGDRPDIIQFASYSLDAYTADSYRGVRKRGAAFNFTIAKPGNINQAIQTVRSGIEGSGGTFTGNEQEGKFQAKGIAGQYRVADLVNVTITEKPFVVPNSMIESEVKKFFGVR